MQISPRKIRGCIQAPSSKSQSLRSLYFALMGSKKSQIYNLLDSPDIEKMLECISLLGAKIEKVHGCIEIEGVSGKIRGAEDILNAGNSGIIYRFLGALGALSEEPWVITGDESIRRRRPIEPLLEGLRNLGAKAFSLRREGGAPIFVQGPIRGGKTKINGEDSQLVSALLLLGIFSPIELEVENPGERPWIDLTLSWLDRFQIPYIRAGYEKFQTFGGGQIPPFSYHVPGDFSSALFPIGACLATGGTLCIENLDFNDLQGDKEVIYTLKNLGADIEIEKEKIIACGKSQLKGGKIDLNDTIDALPLLAALSCFAKEETHLFNAAIARKKECDRIRTMVENLQKMGAEVSEEADGLLIKPSKLKGAHLNAKNDHRVAMALAIAALGAEGDSFIEGSHATSKTYPNFFQMLESISK